MKEYTIQLPTGETTVQLSDEDAEKLGVKPTEPKKKAEPKAESKAAKPANKARTAADKRADAVSKSFGSKADG